jgi:hypothetical protein
MMNSQDTGAETFAMSIQDGLPVPATEAAEQPRIARAFFRSDYDRFARAFRIARTGKDGQLKAPEHQALIDQAVASLAAVMEADSLVANHLPYAFDAAKFAAGTKVEPVVEDDEDEDESGEDEF